MEMKKMVMWGIGAVFALALAIAIRPVIEIEYKKSACLSAYQGDKSLENQIKVRCTLMAIGGLGIEYNRG